METGLKNKTVVITGGASGIGKAAALAFAREGCNVAVCGRSRDKLEALRADFKDMPLFVESVDVTDNAALELFAGHVMEAFGRIDVWVNNAGMSDPMPFDKTSEEAFDRLVNLNFKAVFFGSAIAAKYLKITNKGKTTSGGVIINTSSFSSLVPTAGKMLYSATKAAVNSMTRTMAAELAASNIRVVGIIPGYIQTEMTSRNIAKNKEWLVANIAAKRLGETSDMAGVYVFLASDAAQYITGISLPVAGGKLCVQNPLWSWDREKYAAAEERL